MKIEQQYRELIALKQEINDRLANLDYEKTKELILWLAQSQIFQKLKGKDNQLIYLDYFCGLWIKENKKRDSMGILTNILSNIDSLDSLERKHCAIKHCVLRIENKVPEEYCYEAIRAILADGVSGLAICDVSIRETAYPKENIIVIARYLKQMKQYPATVDLLQTALEQYKSNKQMLMELADCWMEAQQWTQAYDCLKKIKKPSRDIKLLIEELEKVI